VFGLRLTAGVRLSRVVRRAGVRAESLAAAWERTLDALRRHGLARRRDGIWALTPRGLDVADAIGVELLRGIG
jgi:coproporphyrinogen III oxidase-like Fe-S oxidoreductase